MKKCIVVLMVVLMGAWGSVCGQGQLGGDIEGEHSGDSFSVVSLTSNGRRIAIGAPAADSIGTGFANNTGNVRVFDFWGGKWNQVGSTLNGEARHDLFGSAVLLSKSGKRLAVGTPENDGNGSSSGHVRVFEYQRGDWVRLGSDIDGEYFGDRSGAALAFSRSGNRLAIGARTNGTNGYYPGHARVFDWNGTSWNQVGNDIDGIANHDAFGQAVSLSSDGNTLAVGAIGADGNGLSSGEVRVFNLINGNWIQMGLAIEGEAFSDHSGFSVSLSSDAKRVAIGAIDNDNPNGNNAGHVRVYHWNGNAWTQLGNDIDGDASNQNLGYSLSFSSDGNRLVAGGPGGTGLFRIFELYNNNWIQIGRDIDGAAPGDEFGSFISLSSDGKTVAAGAPNNDGNGFNAGHVRVFTIGEALKTGNVRREVNPNCVADSMEPGLSMIPVEIKSRNYRVTGITHPDGFYMVYLDTGIYTATINKKVAPYHVFCPISQQFRIDSTSIVIPHTDFVLEPVINCPYLTAEISTPFIRGCRRGHYTITCCNYGTSDAANAFVDVELDPSLQFINSSIPVSNTSGNVLRFNLDTIPTNTCNTFTVEYKEDCLTVLGQILCSSVHIYPDSLCLDSLPNIQISENCNGDTLEYSIQNLADSFRNPVPYFILENDTTIVDTGSLILGKNHMFTISYPNVNSAKYYQLVIAPNDQLYYSATVPKNCTSQIPVLNLSYLPHSPQAFHDTDCQPRVGSYDPNDKMASPPGVGKDRHLVPNTPLEYAIRFQNTGTDTAFVVNIIDTLSSHLDQALFRPGTSSHPYRFEYLPPTDSGQLVLQFTFDPILLPDSGANQAASNGFVKYSIQMKPNLPIGTRIENRAAIYFDYNAPVITNTVFHTIHLPDTNICIPTKATDVITACNSHTWIDGITYTSANNTATHILTNAAGCDSVVTLNLTIDTVNTSITNLSPTLQSTATNATYQWLDCNNAFAPIPGATSQSFTPTTNGSYAVIIQQNGCTDTSACFSVSNVSIHEHGFGGALRVYPNPTDGQLHIDLGAVYTDVNVRVRNVLGQEVATISADVMQQGELELKGSRGVYFVEIQTGDGGSAVVKIVKE